MDIVISKFVVEIGLIVFFMVIILGRIIWPFLILLLK